MPNFYDSAKYAAGIAKNYITNGLSTTFRRIDVNIHNAGVPYGFTKLTLNTSTILISKGSLNKIAFVPRILNEHVESSRQIHSVVTSTNIVGQIFKASKDNISALFLTLESAGGVVIDDFESYADNAALQLTWLTSGINPALLEQVIVHDALQAMRLTTIVDGEEWTRTAAPQNYTGYTGTFNAYFSHAVDQMQISVFIEDSTGFSKSFVLIQNSADVWQDFEVNEAAMIEDGAWTTDVTDIDTIGYRVVSKKPASFVIIDNLESAPPPGELELKLWDMGDTLPDDGVTSIDDGVQYDQIGAAEAASFNIQLEGGKRLYHFEEFYAGVNKVEPLNKLLTPDNYYILELKYIDTDVSVYGPDTSFNVTYYNNGYCFDVPDEATPIIGIGPFSDIMFGIMSAQEVYFIKIGWRFDATPNGNAGLSVFLEDTNMKITDMVVDHEHSPEKEFTFNAESRPFRLEDGGKLEFYYSDDYSDAITKVSGEATFWYEPPVVNG